MNHGGGLGMHINTNNQDGSKYGLQVHNGKNEILGVLNNGEIRIQNNNGNFTHFNYPDGRNYIRNDTQIDGAFNVNGVSTAPVFIAGPAGQSVQLAQSEVKMRGDGQKHYSIYNNNGTFKINDTSSGNDLGTPGMNLVSLDASKLTLKGNSMLCMADVCVNKDAFSKISQLSKIQTDLAAMQTQLAALNPQQVTQLQQQLQSTINGIQTQVTTTANQLATQQAATQITATTQTIQDQINSINQVLTAIKTKLSMS